MPFYTNLTRNDLILSDLEITIKSQDTVNPQRLNPSISAERLHESESIGSIYRAMRDKKLVKSNGMPKKESDQFNQRLKESDRPIPSRSRVGIAIDPKKKQYIEELTGILDENTLSKFTDYADGFSEPEIEVDEGGVLVQSEPSLQQASNSRYVDIKSRY